MRGRLHRLFVSGNDICIKSVNPIIAGVEFKIRIYNAAWFLEFCGWWGGVHSDLNLVIDLPNRHP